MELEPDTPRGAAAPPRVIHREGSRIGGRYRLEARLAATGMSAVWRATDERLGRTVVVKLMALDLAEQPEARGRFDREARAAAQLASPNIVTVFDYGDSEDVPFMVLELLDGEDLQQRLAKVGKLPPHACLRIAEQTAAALAVAHDAGLVHRDIKPSNLFLARTAGGEGELVKVLDFGIAKLMTESRRTASGTLVGSPLYMSPEQALQRPIGPPTDLYSLGVVLYRCLTGDVPFRGPLAEVLVALVQRPPAAPSAVNPALGIHFDAFFARALAKSPAEREPDVRSFMVSLRAAIAEHDAAVARAAAPASASAASITAATARPSQLDPIPGAGDAETSVFQAPAVARAPLPRTLVSATGVPATGVPAASAPGAQPGAAFDEDAAATAMIIPREVVDRVRAAGAGSPPGAPPAPRGSPRTVPLRAPAGSPAAAPSVATASPAGDEDVATSTMPEALVRHMRALPTPGALPGAPPSLPGAPPSLPGALPSLPGAGPASLPRAAPTSAFGIPEQTLVDVGLGLSPGLAASRAAPPGHGGTPRWTIPAAVAIALVLAIATFVLLRHSG